MTSGNLFCNIHQSYHLKMFSWCLVQIGPGRFHGIAGNAGNQGNHGKFHESHQIVGQTNTTKSNTKISAHY